MRRQKITREIEFIAASPSSIEDRSGCSGIIIHSSRKIVIDTNIGQKETAALLAAEQPDAAIVTHYHLDHAMFGSLLSDGSRTKLFVPTGEDQYLNQKDHMLALITPEHEELEERWRIMLDSSGFRELRNYSLYDESTDFGLEDGGLMQVIRTPGHSPGHSSFYFPRDRILFPGDIGLDKFGPWYGYPDCDLEAYMRSILKLMALEVDVAITCHGGVIHNVHRSLRQCLRIICEREDMIQDKLSRRYSAARIIEERIMYPDPSFIKSFLRDFAAYFDEIALDHHRKVIERGGIRRCVPGIDRLM